MAKGLGKGLNAFFPELEMKEEDQIQEIAIKECRANPYQPRKVFSADAIEELSQSIQEYGILQPLIVRKSIKGYEIVAGERRFRAAKAAGLKKVPVIVKSLDDEKMMELALLENLQREDLTPIEEAQAYSNLMKELDITQEILAKRLGKSRSHIANLVRLLTLPPEISDLINHGELSMGHGRALLGLKDKKKLQSLVEKIRNESLNVRQVEQLIIKMNNNLPEPEKKKAIKDIFLVQTESQLRNQFGTDVTIHRGKRKGKIEIQFFSDEDLERILSVLNR
ncbi:MULTISPECIES: ParB/RepB/Spo0J family partition protein [Terribacillus]|uniref:Chromosome partitioning protein ParB n=1 Tax=Terribacillus saccharophilus TaxID=361277 RepID=A0ABX4GTM1_9BACI|nr:MULTISPECIES: ParB/RepB/Spo0J family partition protein [Terribacillus]PAD33676.1 chromosome partitioning protein ParB [Terribacillus saccharophilus]PAD94488.1 chromosome partitioning protein ParB [Terribacillus saccharophilus]PAD98217.1 chromosome partitioning protein ParB [Terribacillus saccharophilus]VVM34095.1 Chromosome (plasmid) partitioning protein ParB / Stage 0 sporulation protein J [Terribacillus sp. AE2B 122]